MSEHINEDQHQTISAVLSAQHSNHTSYNHYKEREKVIVFSDS